MFSYCGVKVKIDTDRYIGPESAPVRVKGEQIGHVTTAEYGSQMLALGGVHHLTGGSKKEGNTTCQAMLSLCNKDAVEMTIDGGATLTVQAGKPPVIDPIGRSVCGLVAGRQRSGCLRSMACHADEVIVVDDHITGVLSEHQSGKFLDMPPAGIRVRGQRSTPGISKSLNRARAGAARIYRTAVNYREYRPRSCLARPQAFDGQHYRRRPGVFYFR